MEIQTKHRLELLNAKCEYICAVNTMVKKMNYGEDVDCCVNKLYLASRLINRLDCYCFDSAPLGPETILSEWTYSGSNDTFTRDTIAFIVVNGVQLHYDTATDTVKTKAIINDMLVGAGITIDSLTGTSTVALEATAFDDTTSIVITIINPSNEITVIELTRVTEGVASESKCYNCIEDSDLPKTYEVLHKLLQ